MAENRALISKISCRKHLPVFEHSYLFAVVGVTHCVDSCETYLHLDKAHLLLPLTTVHFSPGKT